ncbi:glycosyltransferase [Synechococcus sp. AH-779-G23]|nr:glycosyltransferase family 2 protein [Synechococcus sp. AH-779-G23]MDA9639303.1 glycosyltransferase [Synechococcus sp. AH-779-G23]
MNAFLPQTYLLGLIGLLAIVAVVGGRQFLRVRRDEQSLLKMEQAKVASSKDAGALYELASVQLRKRLYPQAIVTLRQAVKRLNDEPNEARALIENALGYALAAEKDFTTAVRHYKAVTNADTNLLTRVQAMEMAFDALIQQGRLLGGGVSELRGNGQLLRRDVLEACGGFNEDTVTDDLDLSFRFLLQGARTTLLWNPPVREEAVETISALWKQRQRWAEGGLQRFFDYWPGLLSNRLTVGQRRDLACFFLLQYVLPVLSFADLVTSVLTRTSPVYWPLSIVAFGVSGVAYWRGCRRFSEGPALPQPNPFSLLLGIAYLSHWFVVIPWVTLRMALLPKRLVWAKTSHRGTEETVKA